MAPTPSSKSNLITPSLKSHLLKTPNPKRLNFINAAGAPPPEHPVEVIGRIRNHPEKTKAPINTVFSSLLINSDGKSVRVKTENGYRDFSLDGVSSSEDDDIDGFYQKYVESRINGVKLGNKCTIMMYGPTGSGKSHTMFGCAKQPGIVYKSLKEILSDEVEEGNGERLGLGTFVQVTVLEIYNEEIYDLLSSGNTNGGGGGGFSLGWPKGGGPGSTSKVKLEVMGKKAKNATFISGNEAGKILKEIQKVEKRRIIKSTLCNERSSRSHCLIIVDVPTVGGQLMLVDMAGSENIEQAGQVGVEAKLQTAKINQGNIALKRVVESIANGDSHVPFRDSKLTMLLQDSFEDDKSKILMILCSSPDPKELHKTIATLEYGAKAKCIVRGPHTPTKEKGLEDSSSAVILGSRIAALDQFICKLQMENKVKEKERNEAQKELKKKEEEISVLRAKLAVVEGRGSKGISAKANEQTQKLEHELERKIIDCERRANEFIEIEKRKMEERFLQQQQEVDILRFRLHEIETQLSLSKGGSPYLEGNSFLKRLRDSCCEDSDMVKSMDLDRSIDLETNVVIHGLTNNEGNKSPFLLTTVYEEEEEEEDEQNLSDEEVQKEVIEEKRVIVTPKQLDYTTNLELEDTVVSSRELRIKNIFTLCGDYREIPPHDDSTTTPPVERDLKRLSAFTRLENDLKENHNLFDEMGNDLKENCNVLDEKKLLPLKTTPPVERDLKRLSVFTRLENDLKENHNLFDEMENDLKENCNVLDEKNLLPLKTTPPVERELRRLSVFTKLENDLKENHNLFDEKENDLKENCNVFDDDLLPLKTPIQKQSLVPFSPLENSKISEDCFSPTVAPHLISTPFITVRRY